MTVLLNPYEEATAWISCRPETKTGLSANRGNRDLKAVCDSMTCRGRGCLAAMSSFQWVYVYIIYVQKGFISEQPNLGQSSTVSIAACVLAQCTFRTSFCHLPSHQHNLYDSRKMIFEIVIIFSSIQLAFLSTKAFMSPIAWLSVFIWMFRHDRSINTWWLLYPMEVGCHKKQQSFSYTYLIALKAI